MAASQGTGYAIVGIGCRFPGHSNSPREFWRLLCDGVEAVSEIPAERFDIDPYYDPDPSRPGKLYIRRGGFADYADRFDAGFFGIAPREALQMDPQQRMLLEVAWEALEDGGQTLERLAGSRTGVFVGISTHDYGDVIAGSANRHAIEAHTATGTATSIAANRISYVFDLRGPSIALDTACSSSLTAVHLACRSLASGECHLALAGGVNLFLHPHSAMGLARASMLSPDGHCKAFDARANGFVRGEGAGLIVIKPLTAAVRDRDRIYALIRASGINQDGRTVGIMVPNPEAQEAMLREVLAAAAVEPQAVQYMEAHGTGTAVGDPLEAGAIGRVFSAGRDPDSPLHIGSVKTNIGHLEAAAGVAGVIKTALVLQHRLIPPHLNFSQPNPAIAFDALRLKVPVTPQPWPQASGPALAGVNSFGFGGANAHVLMQEAPQREPQPGDEEDRPRVLLLSTKSADALQERASRFAAFLGDAEPNVDDICYTCAERRTHFEHRVAIVGSSRAELRAGLESFVQREDNPNVLTGRAPTRVQSRLVMVFSGMGSPIAAVRCEQLLRERVFREVLERCDAYLHPLAGWSLLAELADGSAGRNVGEVAVAQVKNYAIQAGLTALLRSWGLVPDAVTGHSVGEIAAAQAAGALTLEEGLRLVFHRGRLAQRVSGSGRMLAAALSYDEALQAIGDRGDRVCIAAINSSRSVTLSGESAALEQIAARLEADQRFCRFLPVTVPYHSAAFDSVRDEFLAAVADVRGQQAEVPLASSTLGCWSGQTVFGPSHWWRNFREPVHFAAAMSLLAEEAFDLYLEVGPHPILRTYLTDCLAERSSHALVIATLKHGEDDRIGLSRAAAALHANGRRVDWNSVLGRRGNCVTLPSYPWQHEVFGTGREVADRNSGRLDGIDTGHPLLGVRLPTARPSWQADLDDRRLDYLLDHRVHGTAIYPAAAYIEMALAAGSQLSPGSRISLERIRFDRMLVLTDRRELRIQIGCDTDGRFEIHSCAPGPKSWTAHAKGNLHHEPPAGPPEKVDLGALQQRCGRGRDLRELYEMLEARGLGYSGAFRSIEAVWEGESESIGRLRLAGSSAQSDVPYCLHPALLDCALQVLILARGNAQAAGASFLPAAVERIDWRGPGGTELWVHARVRLGAASGFKGDVRILDEQGNLVLDLQGIEAVSVSTVGESRQAEFALHDLFWTPQARSEPDERDSPLALPSPDAIVQKVARLSLEASGEFSRCLYTPAIAQGLNLAAGAFVRATLDTLGCDWRAASDANVSAVAESIGIGARHLRFLTRLFHIARSTEPSLEQATDPDRLVRQLAADHSEWAGVLELIGLCGKGLGDVLRGKREPQEILFSPAGLTVLRELYSSGPCLAYYNRTLTEVVGCAVQSLESRAKLRVLEIGAGTGGATAAVLEALPAGTVEYCFTDVSPFFLAQARERFAARPELRFALLDIEKAPAGQSLPFSKFDLILAANVVHGTADVRASLNHVRELLAPGGLFVMLELVSAEFWADLMFGLFQGWWRFTDMDLRPAHAILDRQRWVAVLQECGFRDPRTVPDLEADPQPLHTVTIASRDPSAERGPVAVTHKRWLIVCDRRGVAARLASALEMRGCECILADTAEAASRLDDGIAGVIHLASLDLPAVDRLSAAQVLEYERQNLSGVSELLRCAAAADRVPERVWLVTAGAQRLDGDAKPLDVLQAPMWALGRVIMYEFPSVRCRLADVSASIRADELNALAAEICAETDEEELAFRGEQRFVSRLRRVCALDIETSGRERVVSLERGQVRLELEQPGSLDALSLREIRPVAPAPDEVLVRVHAAGLNFKDVMHALGLLRFNLQDPRADARQAFGFECSGVVVEVGASVTRFRPGDEVCGIATGAMASHVRIPEQFTFHRPAALSLDDAAGMLLPFTTAQFGLQHAARLLPGERVLIHSAAGGVGLAAIQISRNAGAEIFATAGTPEKRAFLEAMGIRHVMDSRSGEFADQVRDITGGDGVDVVLNSLAGAAIAKGLSILRPFGRFVELGKRDFVQNSQLGLGPFERNLSFFGVDLDRMRKERPHACAALAQEVIAQFDAGRLQPLPRTDFELSDAASAFRTMAQGKHIGKIVLRARQQRYTARPTSAQNLFSSEATYLITGGLGGFGLATAQWMVEQGARHLVLTGRRAMPAPRNQAALDRLLASEADVAVLPADIACEDQVARLLDRIENTLPPLRGIFHEAMVLDDQKLLDLTPEGWEKVMAPKIAGAWNLHRLTRDLDYFVLFSSSTVVLGNVGQANYAAGNAFLDALARHRRERGLPGLSIAWGLLGSIGLVVDRPDLQRYFQRIGFQPISVEEAFTTLERLLRGGAVYAMPFRMDWSKLQSFSGNARKRVVEMLPAARDSADAEVASEAEDPADLLSGKDRRASLETYLGKKVAKVLGAPAARINTELSLTNLGLDSLMAVELESVIKRDLAVQVTALRLLQGLSIRQLADVILAEAGARPSVPAGAPENTQRVRLPLAAGQRRLWFLQQLDPRCVAYNMPMAMRIEGKLDVPALHAALNDVVRRQDALRATVQIENGEPVQWIAPQAELALPVVDLSRDSEPDTALRRLEREEYGQVFDLSRGPLLRCRLVRLAEEHHVLLATAHHLVVDGWCLGIISQQAAQSYAAHAHGARLPAHAPTASYSAFVLRQLERVAECETRQLAYWKEQLAGVAPLELAADRPHPAQLFMPCVRQPFELPADLCASLEQLAKREGATLFMLLLAAFDVLMARHSGQDDFCVGSPVASRSGVEATELVGCFVNTVALRARVRGSLTFLELLAQTKQTVLAAFANQDVSWERVVEAVQPPRLAGRLPVFQTLFVVHNMPKASVEAPGLRLTATLVSPGSSPFDLMMLIDSKAGQCALEYSRSLFDAPRAHTLIDDFMHILTSAVGNPDGAIGALLQLRGAERETVLVEWNLTAASAPDCALHELFERQARRAPDGIAVVAADRTLTYRELDQAAHELAAVLRDRGAGPETLVGVALTRSAQAVVAMLGTLKAGAAFVPLDPAYPAQRLGYMLQDANPHVVLTEEKFSGRFEDGARLIVLNSALARGASNRVSSAPQGTAGPASLAYVMYTSGSTGKPKGVMIEHRNICNQIAWRQSVYPLTDDDAVLQSTSLSFDPSVWEIFGPLTCGARVVVMPEGVHDGAVLRRTIRQHGITVMQAVPSVLRALLDQHAFEGCHSLQRIFCGGETLDAALQERFSREVDAELTVLYGCTETAIDATHRSGTATGALIGRPIANTRVYILNEDGDPVPVGVPGQLVVAGSCVARGYWNDPALTGERFVGDPFAADPGERAYRTGDLARWRPGGVLEFLGRADRQRKVRGFRIEPAEIEQALMRLTGIRAAAVDVRQERAGGSRLIAWIERKANSAIEIGELKAALAQSLPEFMLPSRYVWVDALPLTPTGKLDPARLPEPVESERTYSAPRTELEQQIVRVWEELLGAPSVGISDNFFDMGGHSLLAVRLASRMGPLLGRDIPCDEIFAKPTIEALVGTHREVASERVPVAARA
ncbi:MAG TPA: amino acid adenylation domain-containing protein [Burkholderiales bacterium]|nr:amino acid adenylation domain-containing protein [Burkholderiales bacterium]